MRIPRSLAWLASIPALAACSDPTAPVSPSPPAAPPGGLRGEYGENSGAGFRTMTLADRVSRRFVTDEDRAIAQRLRREQGTDRHDRLDGAVAPASSTARLTPTERAILRARSLPGNPMLKVSIYLEDPATTLMRPAHGDVERTALMQARTDALRPSQDGLEERLAAIGVRVEHRSWLVNAVDVSVPAARVAEIAGWPGIESVTVSTQAVPEQAGWNGDQIRTGIRTHQFISAGYDGNAQSRCCITTPGSHPIRLGIIEQASRINPHHVGWLDTRTSGNRVKRTYTCNPTCTSVSFSGGEDCNHGYVVSWMAAGSIEQNQDVNYPGTGTPDQRQRSGVAPEAYIYYYEAEGSTNIRNAIEKAVADGVDVINMSWGLQRCDAVDTTTYDDNLNAALRNALSAGVLLVKSAGNNGNVGAGCTVTYPAWRPEVLAVGALDNQATNTDLNSTPIWDGGSTQGSSHGGAHFITRNDPTGGRHSASNIGLAAPGRFDIPKAFGRDPNLYCSVNAWPLNNIGTSGAAAVVSGTAGLLRDAIKSLGFSGGDDARFLMVNMLLMGDAWDTEGLRYMERGVSKETGFGRLHAHFPSDANLTAPWGWGWHAEPMTKGEIVSWTVGGSGAEPASVTQWKWAVAWFDTSLAATSDLVAYVKDTCDGNRVIASDLSFDFRKRVHLRSDKIAGKCLIMELQALEAPSGGVTVYSADYFHSGSTTHH